MQVTDAFTDADVKSNAPACKHTGGLQLLSNGQELVPALGLAWANCVNTRIFLSKTDFAVSTHCLAPVQAHSSIPQPATLPLRCMQVVFSPCLPPDSCLYVVSQGGLQGVNPAQLAAGDVQHYHQEAEQEQGCQAVHHSTTPQHGLACDNQKPSVQSSAAQQPDYNTVLQDSNNELPEGRTTLGKAASSKHTCTMATGVFASF